MSSVPEAALVPSFLSWVPCRSGVSKGKPLAYSLSEMGAVGDIVPYSWRVLAPTLLRCVLVLESPNTRHPGAVGGDVGSWKVVSPSDGPGSGEGLTVGCYTSIFSLFPAVGILIWDLPEGWRAWVIAHAGDESG